MARQTIKRGIPSPVFYDETGTRQHILRGATFVEENIPILATLTATQDNQTVVATAVVKIASTLTATQADQTVVATAAVGIAGTLTATQADQTVSATATVSLTGSLTQTQDDQTVVATAAVGIVATLTAAQADQTVVATGTLTVSGTLTQTQDDQTIVAIGALTATGTLTATQDDQSIVATAEVEAAGEGDAGTAATHRHRVVAGGVAANEMLSRSLRHLTESLNFRLCVPPPALCTDNGAMVAWAGLERAELGLLDGLETAARARWPLDFRRAGVAGAKS